MHRIYQLSLKSRWHTKRIKKTTINCLIWNNWICFLFLYNYYDSTTWYAGYSVKQCVNTIHLVIVNHSLKYCIICVKICETRRYVLYCPEGIKYDILKIHFVKKLLGWTLTCVVNENVVFVGIIYLFSQFVFFPFFSYKNFNI